MTPLKDRLLAEIIEADNTTKSGIILPVNHKNKYRAKVLFVGPNAKHVRVNDVVRYHQGHGTPHIHDGRNCIFLHESVDIDFIE